MVMGFAPSATIATVIQRRFMCFTARRWRPVVAWQSRCQWSCPGIGREIPS